jgi:hypothetical protein
MILTGQQRRILKEGILGAYPNEDELSILLSEKMDVRYSAMARGEDYISRVAYLVEKLEADGVVERLIRVVVEKKPNSPYLTQVRSESTIVNHEQIKTIGNYVPNAQGSNIINAQTVSGNTIIGTQYNYRTSLASTPPRSTDGNAVVLWRRKLEYLQLQEAIASDPSLKFQLQEQIKECQDKIRELGG